MHISIANNLVQEQPRITQTHLGNGATKAMSATPLKLSKRMDIEQAFQIIAFNCLGQIEANAVDLAQEYDAESLHQMRVGLRRLRCAADLFGEVLTLPDFLLQELDWFGMQLGTARDWDVLSAFTLPAVIDAYPVMPVDQEKWNRLLLAALNKASAKDNAVTAAVRSKRYALLIIFCNSWVQGCEWRDSMSIKEKTRLGLGVARFARNTIECKQSQLHKRVSQLSGEDPKALHRIRIAAKNLRYALTFFYSLCPAKKIRPYLTELSRVQETLGCFNDVELARQLLKELRAEDRQLAGSSRLFRARMALMPIIDIEDTRKSLKKICRIKNII